MQKQQRLLECMDRLQIFRFALVTYCEESTKEELLDTVANALLPHVPLLHLVQAQALLQRCAARRHRHPGLCGALAAYTCQHHAETSGATRKRLSAAFVELGWLSTGLAVALEEPRLAPAWAESRPAVPQPPMHSRNRSGKRPRFQMRDGLAALRKSAEAAVPKANL